VLPGEELDRLVHRHAQHVADRAAADLHAEHLGPVAAALALLAGDVHVLEEVHLELLEAVALTRLAAAARHVEREGAGPETEGAGARQRREQLADLVEGLDVGDRIGARRPPDRLLVDEPHALEVLEANQRVVGAGRQEFLLERPRHRPVERVVHQRGLAGTGHAGDDGEGAERHPQRDVFQVVLAGAGEDQLTPAGAAGQRQRDRLPPRQVPRGQ
jgi:hypothetical protein